MKTPLTVVGGIVTLIGLILVSVWVFSASGNDLTSEQRNLAFITVIGLVANSIPSILALLKSEATQNDLRNGVVKNNVKDAIEEAHVITTESPLVAESSQTTNAALRALTQLLETNTAATRASTQALNEAQDERDRDNGRPGI